MPLCPDFIDRMRLPFRRDRELYAVFRDMLGFYPHDIRPYRQAIMHRSAVVRQGMPHNERLEYLGDAILEAVTSDILYHHFPDQREGFLTNTRSKLVQRDTLNRLSHEMRLDRLVQSDPSTHTQGNNIGGNALEALIGAIYLDRGYDACMTFVKQRILAQMVNIDKMAAQEVNFKSKLLEWCQKHHLDIEFRVKEGSNSTFHALVVIGGMECGSGNGKTKKESHQEAAHATLLLIRNDRTLHDALLQTAPSADTTNL